MALGQSYGSPLAPRATRHNNKLKLQAEKQHYATEMFFFANFLANFARLVPVVLMVCCDRLAKIGALRIQGELVGNA
jgi:hypothetical protein